MASGVTRSERKNRSDYRNRKRPDHMAESPAEYFGLREAIAL